MARIDTLHTALTKMPKTSWIPSYIYDDIPNQHFFIIIEVFFDTDIRKYLKQFLNQIEDL